MKPLVIYHKNCNDGFGAATCAYTALKGEAEFLPVQYNDALHQGGILEHVTGRDVYILDFSFPRVTTEKIRELCNRFVWLDHHKTAFEEWVGTYKRGDSYDWNNAGSHILLDDNRSGALIAFDFFNLSYHDCSRKLCEHLDDYDRWQFKLAGTKNVNSALRSKPMEFALWSTYLIYPHLVDALETDGAAIERYRELQVKQIAARPTQHAFPGHEGEAQPQRGLAVNCPAAFTSDVGHVLAKLSGSYGLCWSLKSDGETASVSLRSNGEYDVSILARRYGGGGHKNAAGFEVPLRVLLSMFSGEAKLEPR